jgi:CheY-like chemotaxis protein
MRILLVEDDGAVMQALSMVLQQEGYDVVPARNGKEALSALEDGAPDLIILDLWMPVMNGWEFLAELRELDEPVRDLPVIAVSADVKASKNLPVRSFMTKPMDMEQLLTEVRASLQKT